MFNWTPVLVPGLEAGRRIISLTELFPTLFPVVMTSLHSASYNWIVSSWHCEQWETSSKSENVTARLFHVLTHSYWNCFTNKTESFSSSFVVTLTQELLFANGIQHEWHSCLANHSWSFVMQIVKNQALGQQLL